jgi:hypothetical protein
VPANRCRLEVLIGPERYTLRIVPREPGCELRREVVLRRIDEPAEGEPFHVAEDLDGSHLCGCVAEVPDDDELHQDCRHVRALVALGLFSATPPRKPVGPCCAARQAAAAPSRDAFGAGILDGNGKKGGAH